MVERAQSVAAHEAVPFARPFPELFDLVGAPEGAGELDPGVELLPVGGGEVLLHLDAVEAAVSAPRRLLAEELYEDVDLTEDAAPCRLDDARRVFGIPAGEDVAGRRGDSFAEV